jgi:NAD(P)-dependent dehydrogenase (short-subunit alcohol dehydrogenase family)
MDQVLERNDVADAHTEQPKLAGRKAIITGGSTGIGRAIAVLLASEGAEVFICGRNSQHLDDGLARIREVGKGEGIALDLAEEGAPERFVEEAKKRLGGIDVAIINAAIGGGELTEIGSEKLHYVVATDFTAYLASAHAAAEALGDKGDMILIGSTSAHSLGAGDAIYAGIKAGVAGFSEALAKELGPKGIKVSLVEPGSTGSDMQYEEFSAEEQAEEIEAERMLRAEDIAVACCFVLTQPRRAIVQQLTMVPRIREE